MGAAQVSLRIHLLSVAMLLVGTGIGATLDGVRGAAVALTVVAVLSAGLWWGQFTRTYAARLPEPAGLPPLGEPTAATSPGCTSDR